MKRENFEEYQRSMEGQLQLRKYHRKLQSEFTTITISNMRRFRKGFADRLQEFFETEMKNEIKLRNEL